MVVDSIIRLYRFPDEKQQSEKRGEEKRQLTEVLQKLQGLSRRGVAVVVTNEVSADLSAKSSSHSQAFKPAGGVLLARFLTARLQFRAKTTPTSFRKMARFEPKGETQSELGEDFPFLIKSGGIYGVEEDENPLDPNTIVDPNMVVAPT